jgi:hypothetical protein
MCIPESLLDYHYHEAPDNEKILTQVRSRSDCIITVARVMRRDGLDQVQASTLTFRHAVYYNMIQSMQLL